MDNAPSFISAFIELYRQHPCLWKMKDDNYSNKRRKDQAYGVLLDFYKKTVASATMDTVKKKINNLRCAHRKELKKVKKLGSEADYPYTPTLWYYDLLLFSAEQEESKMPVGSDKPTPVTSNAETDTTPCAETPDNSLRKKRHPSPPVHETFSHPKKKKLSSTQTSQTQNDSPIMVRNTESASNTLRHDEFDTFGQHVANQLRSLPLSNAIVCQNFINSYLAEERLKVINEGYVSNVRTTSSIYGEDTHQHYLKSTATASNSSFDPQEDYLDDYSSDQNLENVVKIEESSNEIL